MSPQAAISQLAAFVHVGSDIVTKKDREAMALAIEALKQYKEMKAMGEVWPNYLLPGETED